MKTAFEPIADANSRILILGTMPGERSLQLQQYYGHAGNHFWMIMFSILERPFSTDYTERKKLLADHMIALWDVLQNCEGEGSSDNAIKNEYRKAGLYSGFCGMQTRGSIACCDCYST